MALSTDFQVISLVPPTHGHSTLSTSGDTASPWVTTSHPTTCCVPDLRQIQGLARVDSVTAAPRIAGGEGSAVTGRFITRQVDIIARIEVLAAAGQVDTIEGTTIHPVWSLDRDDWVTLEKLEQGEQLLAAAGPTVVLTHTILQRSTPVYNIEVHGEHVYPVGQSGLLMHNACSPTSGNSFFAKVGQAHHKSYMSHIDDGVARIKEFILPSGRRIDFLDTVTGTIFELKPNNARAIRRGIAQLDSYIQELQSMPQFNGINWKATHDLY